MPAEPPIRLLLIEDDENDAFLLRHSLSAVDDSHFEIQHVVRVAAGIDLLDKIKFDAILLDLSLPDGYGLSSYYALRDRAAGIPVLIITGHDDQVAGQQAVQAGAQEYIVKGGLTGRVLAQIIRHAIERQRLYGELADRSRRIEASERGLRRLLEMTSDAILVFDRQRQAVFATSSAEAMLGRPMAELMGDRFEHLLAPEPVEMEIVPGLTAEVETVEIEWHGQPSFAVRLKDVTERRQAIEALAASERHFRALIDNAFDAIMLVDPAGALKYVSPATRRIMGYADSELLGRSPLARVHRDDREATERLLADLVQRPGETVTGQFRMLHQDATYRWLDAVCTNLLNEPSVGAVVINFRDATARLAAEAAMRESEERYRIISQMTSDYTYVLRIEADGGLIREWVAGAFSRIMGSTPDEVEQYGGPFAQAYPDDMPILTRRLQRLLTGEPDTSEYRIYTKAGEVRWLRDYARPEWNEAGTRVARIIGAARDITDRRQALEALRLNERRFRALIENSTDVIALNDVEGKLLYVSPSCERVEGYKPEELLGTRMADNIHPDDLGALTEVFQWLLNHPGSPRAAMLRRRHKNGEWRWIEGVATSLLQEPAVKALVLNYRDITERRQAEEDVARKSQELAAMSQQLWQTAKLATMGELAASIAHELNNPLATVSLRLESLLESLTPDDSRRHGLEVAQQEAERMGRLVTDLLQFSRRGTKRISTLDLVEEVERALELVTSHLGNRKIEVVREFAPGLPPLQADRQQLRQVLLNLITNAADAMPDGGALTLRLRSDGEALTLEVTDTGMGIASDNMPRLMEPFFTTKPAGRGTGLGLAVCRRIVAEHGGQFEMLSEGPGQGATARVRLLSSIGDNGNKFA